MHIYVANWDFRADEDGFLSWTSPIEEATGRYDLRTHAQCARRGGVPQGTGVFVYETRLTIPNSTYLGDDPLRAMTLTERNGLEDILGFTRGTLPAGSFANALGTSIKGTEADPAGVSAVVPLSTHPRLGAVINIEGFGEIYREPFSAATQSFQDTLAIRRNDYRRRANAGVPLVDLERWTGYDMLKYFGALDGTRLADLIPVAEFPTHSFREPTSTFGDTFVEASDTNLEAHTPTGANAGSGWTLETGSAGTIQVRATPDLAETSIDEEAFYFMDDNLASDDHYAEAVITDGGGSGSGFCALVVRKDVENTLTYYHFQIRVSSTPQIDRVRIVRYNTNTPTTLATDSSPTSTLGSTIRAEANGSVITCYDDGVSDLSTTDGSPLSGQTLCGIRSEDLGSTHPLRWDDYVEADLSAGATIPIFHHHYQLLRSA